MRVILLLVFVVSVGGGAAHAKALMSWQPPVQLSATHRRVQAWPEPGAVFDALWSAFDRTYALFQDKAVPWQAVGNAYRPRALRATTEDELFDVLAEMLATLNDNHVKLTGWSRMMSAGGDLRGAGPPEDFSAQLVRQRYLVAPMSERVGGSISFGWLPDSLGYIHVTRMADARASGEALDEALATFVNARGVVLDLRGNSGGDDHVGQALAGHFADRPRHYMTTRLKSGPGADDFTGPRYWHIEPPAGGGFTRPLAVLTHNFTFSAGENFVLALRVLPHATVIGTRTSGSMGETTNDVLPNGWVYRTVMARIVDGDGRSWEGIGIPPHLRVVNSPDEMRAGRDRVLEAAMEIIPSGRDAITRSSDSSGRAAAPVRLPLADSLADWIDERGLTAGIEQFERLRGDTMHWFLAEDWEYGDLTTLGRRLLREDQVVAAIAVLEAAATAYPQSYRPHLWLARAHERAGQERQASSARRRALALNRQAYADDRRAAIELRGRIPLSYLFLDQLFDEGVDAAIHTYRRLKSGDPARVDIDTMVLVRGGQQLREAGQQQAARDVFAFIVEEFPGASVGYLGLAEILSAMGDLDAARRAYLQALNLDVENRPAREGLARLNNAAEARSPRDGGWVGTVSNDALEAAVRLCLPTDGGQTPTVDLPDFGYYDVPVRLDAGRNTFTASFSIYRDTAHITFDVRGDEATGRWDGAGAPGLVRLRRSEHCGARYRPEPVSFQSGDRRLAGTLLIPTADAGPFPLVVWAHGSGPIDRTEPIYRGLAVALTELGVASLIYDKQGTGESSGNYRTASMHDLAADAVAGVERGRRHSSIIAHAVGVGGISQAGWIAPIAASISADVAFVVALSAPGVSPAEQNLFNQFNKVLNAGFPESTALRADAILREIYRYYRTGTGRAAIESTLDSISSEPWFEAAYELAIWHNRGLMKGPVSESYRTELDFDPIPIWRRVVAPTVLMWGEADDLVPAHLSARLIGDALKQAGNTDRVMLIFPRADHTLRLPAIHPWSRGFLHPGYRSVADFVLDQIGSR